MVPPNHPNINKVFHYQPSILGYPYFWKHPYRDYIPWSGFPMNQPVQWQWNVNVVGFVFRCSDEFFNKLQALALLMHALRKNSRFLSPSCWQIMGRWSVKFLVWHSFTGVLRPSRLTWNKIIGVWKIIFLSKWVICMFHVNLPGCSFLLVEVLLQFRISFR